jgi:hypothetical protein
MFKSILKIAASTAFVVGIHSVLASKAAKKKRVNCSENEPETVFIVLCIMDWRLRLSEHWHYTL